MAAPRVERRLAAIPAAGIVGYSRLADDEAGTLAAVRRLRTETIGPILAEDQGCTSSLWATGR
jgi:adenylate cyclase